jgi:hypothetical protein
LWFEHDGSAVFVDPSAVGLLLVGCTTGKSTVLELQVDADSVTGPPPTTTLKTKRSLKHVCLKTEVKYSTLIHRSSTSSCGAHTFLFNGLQLSFLVGCGHLLVERGSEYFI